VTSNNPLATPEEAADLIRWLETDGVRNLGSEVNRWLQVYEVAYGGMRFAVSADDRRDFRTAALLLLDKARQAAVLPEPEIITRQVAVRLAYAREGGESEQWRAGEMREIADLALDHLPIDLEFTREKAPEWHSVSHATAASYVQSQRDFILLSYQAKNLLKLTSGTMDYLDSDRLKRVEEWLRVLPDLPRTAKPTRGTNWWQQSNLG
jgi:hypothetical protein